MGRMAGVEMMKGDNHVLSIVNRTSSPLCDKISLPTVTANNTIITVNGFPSTVNRTFLYPIRAQGCMTSSLPMYCTPDTQSSLILTPNAIRPSLVACPVHQDKAMPPGAIGPIKSEQLTSFMETTPLQGNRTDTQSSVSTNVFECRWMKCDRRFLQLDDLVNHVNDQHVKVERPDVDYQCKWTGCSRQGRGFNARYKMLIHIRTHTNEKPHKCLICGKSFSRLENLKIHNRSHTGEKPYICPFPGCNKAYSNSSDRFKHVRTHQNQKPYICKMPGCNKRYTDPSSLRKHVRTHGHYVNVSSENKNNNNQTADVSARVKGDNSQSPVTRSEDNKQFVILSASAPFSTRNSNGDLEKRGTYGDLLSSTDKQATPLTLCTTPSLSSSLNLSSINQSPLISDLLPHVMTAVPVSFSETPDKVSCDMECQDRPLDLSCSPVSPSVSLASLSPLSFQ